MSYKIIEDGENFKIKELDENGNSVKVLEEVFATHEEATKFILDLEGGTEEKEEVKGEDVPVSTEEKPVDTEVAKEETGTQEPEEEKKEEGAE